MSDESQLNFAFDFGTEKRSTLLAESERTVRGLKSALGPGAPTGDAATEAAANLLAQLNQEVVEFSAFPDVLPLKEEHFSQHGMTVPIRFQDLSRDFNFYWMYFPLTLSPLENFPFAKLELAVEFNPGVAAGHLRPRAHMILPDKKFKKLLELSDSLEVGIGEDFEFKATTGQWQVGASAVSGAIAAVAAAAGGIGGQPGPGGTGVGTVEAKLAGKLGLMVGPFKYTLKKALIEHSPVGTEKVFWRVASAEFFQENDPTFIVVLQVPKSVKEVQIAAALQAYHQANLGAMGLTQAINYLRTQLANFFRAGAPACDTQVWDISARL